jgi:hypothetical protein
MKTIDVQRYAKTAGLYSGDLDNAYGPKTAAALRASLINQPATRRVSPPATPTPGSTSTRSFNGETS